MYCIQKFYFISTLNKTIIDRINKYNQLVIVFKFIYFQCQKTGQNLTQIGFLELTVIMIL